MEPAADLDIDQILEWHRRRCWCGIYTRQSRESHTEISSCEAQFDACFAFVQSQFDESWLWNGERYDDEGQSSETLDRPALKRLLEDVRAGKVQRVLVHRIDRLSRRMADWAELLQELRDCGAELTVVTQPELSGGAADTLVLNVLAAFAAFEQEIIRERLADARAAHKRRGRRVAGITPYGYKAHPETKQLVVVEQEARRVRKMFRMAAAGKTPREIACIANQRGWPKKAPGGWTPRHVLAVLSNPVYVGLIRDGNVTRPGIHQAIVGREQFECAQEVIQSRRTREPGWNQSTSLWPLRGRLRCGRCGRRMIPSTSRRANILYQYYRCRSHAGGRAPCHGVSIRASEIERYLVELLGSDDLAADAQSNAQREDARRFAGLWSGLNELAQRKLVADVLEEAVYDVRAGTLSVSLHAQALERVTGQIST